jgi:hypothetical protein
LERELLRLPLVGKKNALRKFREASTWTIEASEPLIGPADKVLDMFCTKLRMAIDEKCDVAGFDINCDGCEIHEIGGMLFAYVSRRRSSGESYFYPMAICAIEGTRAAAWWPHMKQSDVDRTRQAVQQGEGAAPRSQSNRKRATKIPNADRARERPCDLCGYLVAGNGESFTQSQMLKAADRGLVLRGALAEMGKLMGLSDQQARETWKKDALATTVSWMLCPKCASEVWELQPDSLTVEPGKRPDRPVRSGPAICQDRENSPVTNIGFADPTSDSASRATDEDSQCDRHRVLPPELPPSRVYQWVMSLLYLAKYCAIGGVIVLRWSSPFQEMSGWRFWPMAVGLIILAQFVTSTLDAIVHALRARRAMRGTDPASAKYRRQREEFLEWLAARDAEREAERGARGVCSTALPGATNPKVLSLPVLAHDFDTWSVVHKELGVPVPAFDGLQIVKRANALLGKQVSRLADEGEWETREFTLVWSRALQQQVPVETIVCLCRYEFDGPTRTITRIFRYGQDKYAITVDKG